MTEVLRQNWRMKAWSWCHAEFRVWQSPMILGDSHIVFHDVLSNVSQNVRIEISWVHRTFTRRYFHHVSLEWLPGLWVLQRMQWWNLRRTHIVSSFRVRTCEGHSPQPSQGDGQHMPSPGLRLSGNDIAIVIIVIIVDTVHSTLWKTMKKEPGRTHNSCQRRFFIHLMTHAGLTWLAFLYLRPVFAKGRTDECTDVLQVQFDRFKGFKLPSTSCPQDLERLKVLYRQALPMEIN